MQITLRPTMPATKKSWKRYTGPSKSPAIAFQFGSTAAGAPLEHAELPRSM